MYCHYIFRTYKGKSTLKYKGFKDHLKIGFETIANEKGFKLLASNVLEDHVHLVVRQSSSDSSDYVMRMFKGISSRRFFTEFPSNRFEHRKLWGRGYYIKIIKEQDLPKVINYIENQTLKDGSDKRYQTNRESLSRQGGIHSQVSSGNTRVGSLAGSVGDRR